MDAGAPTHLGGASAPLTQFGLPPAQAGPCDLGARAQRSPPFDADSPVDPRVRLHAARLLGPRDPLAVGRRGVWHGRALRRGWPVLDEIWLPATASATAPYATATKDPNSTSVNSWHAYNSYAD